MMLNERSDEDLLTAVRGGDTGSLGTLVARWEQPLFRFVYRHLPKRELAQDICQETFLRVLKKADRFKEGGKYSTWMYQIALNLCRDHARKKKRWSVLVEEKEIDQERCISAEAWNGGPGNPAVAYDQAELKRSVTKALDSLPAEQREVLIMKEFEGLKFREIADIIGCPESTVKSRMYYGLRGLRTALSRQGVAAG